MSANDFTVDLDTLAHLIARMSQCEDTLDDLTNEVEHTVSRMHETWSGEAAQAQRLAHAKWEHGLMLMRASITDLREKSNTAHQNYQAAGDANMQMWQDIQ